MTIYGRTPLGIFTCQPQRGGTSDNPTVQVFFNNTQALRVVNNTDASVGSISPENLKSLMVSDCINLMK